jgi:hypothetical protein
VLLWLWTHKLFQIPTKKPRLPQLESFVTGALSFFFFFFFVKVTVKFIRRGTVWRKEREAFPVPHAGNGSKDSHRCTFSEQKHTPNLLAETRIAASKVTPRALSS